MKRIKFAVGLNSPQPTPKPNISRGCKNCGGKGYIGEVHSALCAACYGMREPAGDV